MTARRKLIAGNWKMNGLHDDGMALARELARAVVQAGGRIYARSPVDSFERRGDNWVVRTAKGEINGRALVVATNAYSGEFSASLVPEIAREVVELIRILYAIEKQAQDVSVAARWEMRQTRSAPLLAQLQEKFLTWKEQLLPKHPMAGR